MKPVFRSLLLVVIACVFGQFRPALALAAWVSLPGGGGEGTPAVVQAWEKGDDIVTVRVRLAGFERELVESEGTRFERIALPGAGSLREPGRPALPVVGVPLLLEGAGEVLDVRVRTQRIEGVMPVPFARRPKRCGGGASWRLSCDTALYASPAPYPEARVRAHHRGALRRVPTLLLEVRPFRFFPATRRLEAAWEVEVDLAGRLATATHSRYAARAFAGLQDAFFARPFKLRLDAPREALLIIAHDELLSALDEFVAWKEQRGLEVTVVPLSQVGDTHQEVKQYIQAAYDGWENPPVYVLLVGDGNGAGKVPFVPSSYGCASDFLYSTLDGDDLYSDVLMGRISAHTADEVAVQLRKAVWYEKELAQDSQWIPGSVCISSSEGSGGSNDDVRSDIVCDLQEAHGYAPADRFYHSTGNDTAANISAAVNEGRGWLTYLGHGSGHSWATTQPPYANDHVEALENPFRLPFVVDVSCSNGEFDATAGDCFAEAWMKTGAVESPRAAVGIYSASTPTAWDEPAEMAVGMTHALLEDGIHEWSALAAAGRAYSMQVLPGGGHEEVAHQYVVFGDPTLRLRTQAAWAPEVEHGQALPLGGVEFPVSVARAGQAVAGVTVAVSLPGGGLVVGKTGADGTAPLWIEATTAGEATVTVTAPNAALYEATVETLVPGCGLLQASPAPVACEAALALVLFDADLNEDTQTAQSAVVTVTSDVGGEADVTLTETGPDTGKFVGEVALSEVAGPGAVAVAHGAVVTVSYDDAQCADGAGPKTAVVSADCVAPEVTSVTFGEVEALSATVTVETSEPTVATLRYGSGVPPADEVTVGLSDVHEVKLTGLVPDTLYYVAVEAADPAGNVTVADDGGAYYQFTTQACMPQCAGKQCGPDGCGGSCGGCCETQSCQDGQCLGGPGCEVTEGAGCDGCACEDCVCGADPYCCTVQWDEICVDECVMDCGGCGAEAACQGKECGSDGCGGVCGTCPDGWGCTDAGECLENCPADCTGKQCGSDGCGGSCGVCEEGEECVEGQCLAPCPSEDMVGCCDGTVSYYCEDGFEFAVDCADQGKTCGWSDNMGWYDCVAEQKEDPSGTHPLWCPGVCPPVCEGKECGPDGCGGECGLCEDGYHCENGLCASDCEPQCEGRECGDDGCGGLCGECAMGLVCEAGACTQSCVPECVDRQCGADGCGGVCGKCSPGMECNPQFQCVLEEFEPDVVEEDTVTAELDETPRKKRGGCTAGPTAGGGLWLLALLVLALWARRTRSRTSQE